MHGNDSVARRQQSRECLDAQIMKASGEASGRLSDKIIEGPTGRDSQPANSVLECCEALRGIGLDQLAALRQLLTWHRDSWQGNHG